MKKTTFFTSVALFCASHAVGQFDSQGKEEFNLLTLELGNTEQSTQTFVWSYNDNDSPTTSIDTGDITATNVGMGSWDGSMNLWTKAPGLSADEFLFTQQSLPDSLSVELDLFGSSWFGENSEHSLVITPTGQWAGFCYQIRLNDDTGYWQDIEAGVPFTIPAGLIAVSSGAFARLRMVSNMVTSSTSFTTNEIPDWEFSDTGMVVSFNRQSDGECDITYTYDFGDGSDWLMSTEASVQHTYTYPGTYQVTLLMPSCEGQGSAVTGYVTIECAPMSAQMEWAEWNGTQHVPENGIWNVEVENGESIPPVTFVASGNGVAIWYYDFGDGTEIFQQSPTHTYDSFGTYEVLFFHNTLCEAASDTFMVVISQVSTLVESKDESNWNVFHDGTSLHLEGVDEVTVWDVSGRYVTVCDKKNNVILPSGCYIASDGKSSKKFFVK